MKKIGLSTPKISIISIYFFYIFLSYLTSYSLKNSLKKNFFFFKNYYHPCNEVVNILLSPLANINRLNPSNAHNSFLKKNIAIYILIK